MKFTQIPTTAMEEMQLNAGILLSSFTPSTAEVSGIIGATTGGIKFSATPTYSDFGEDIDNCPKNMMELKRQDSVEGLVVVIGLTQRDLTLQVNVGKIC